MDTSIKVFIGLVVLFAVFSIFGTSYYLNIKEQNAITANTISDLQKELDEQGQLTAEQEIQLEQLAQVTCKDVQVPYDAQESYTEQEPYSAEECEFIDLAYNKVNNYCTDYVDNTFFADEPAEYSVTINNLDSENGGTFIVDIGFNINGQPVKQSKSQYIYPASSATFYAEQMAEIDNCYFVVTNLPQKQVCETVTKYNTVTKYRTVTKYKTETVCE